MRTAVKWIFSITICFLWALLVDTALGEGHPLYYPIYIPGAWSLSFVVCAMIDSIK